MVIPTRDRWDKLERTLRALEAQDLREHAAEIVVVDNGSTDGSLERVRGLVEDFDGDLRVLVEAKRGPAAARNTGVAAARSRLILFLGDDTPPAHPDLLLGHIRLDSEADDVWRGTLGRSVWDPAIEETPVMEWCQRSGNFFNYELLEREEPQAGSFYTNNVSLRCEAFEAVGGFDERFPDASVEDVELGVRLFDAGFRLEYDPDLLVYHDHWYDFEASLKRMEVTGRAINLLRRLHPNRPDIDAPYPSPGKTAVGRVLAPIARAVPFPTWLPRRARDRAYRIAHRAAMVRGYTSQPVIPDDPALRGREIAAPVG